jgi:hypothetical protein
MHEMEKKYDPLTQIVVRSDCNRNRNPHSGSGILFSRRAIQELLPFGNFSIWGMKEESADRRIGRLIRKIGSEECSSSAFLGILLLNDQRQKLMNGEFEGLQECPIMKCVERKCNQIVRPTRQIVFYHVGVVLRGGRSEFETRVRSAQKLWESPKELGVMNGEFDERMLCWQKEKLLKNDLFVLL